MCYCYFAFFSINTTYCIYLSGSYYTNTIYCQFYIKMAVLHFYCGDNLCLIARTSPRQFFLMSAYHTSTNVIFAIWQVRY